MITVLEDLCGAASRFYARGSAFGSAGNVSIRSDDLVWITPTGRSLRSLVPDDLAWIDLEGNALNDRQASKESPFHLAVYRSASERARAIVHLHAPHAVALSCLESLDENNPLPAITPYYLMRIAPLATIPYFRPGSPELTEAVGEAARDHICMLLRNHGLIAVGRTLEDAVDRAEELEEAAGLYFLLRGERIRLLTVDQQNEIVQATPRRA